MKRTIHYLIILAIILTFAGCTRQNAQIVNTVETGYKTYYELDDGTWQADNRNYKYKLEISGRMPSAAVESTFVYLSNIENISFEQAWKAAGFSSSTADYFNAEDAVLVDIRTE